MAAEPARKQTPAATAAAGAKQPKPRRALPWILITVAVLGGGGGAAWWAMKPAVAATHGTAASVPKAPPIYYKFDPAFVVNFGGPTSARYFQVTVEAMARDPKILQTLKDNDPAVRNNLIMLYSSQDAATLMSTAGKEKLRASTLAAIQQVLDQAGADGNQVEQVYFTSFVIQ